MSINAVKPRRGLSVRSKLLIMTGLPLALLLVLSVALLSSQFEEYGIAQLMDRNVALLRAVAKAVNHLQRERGRSSVYLNSGDAKSELLTQRGDTDVATETALISLQGSALSDQDRQPAIAALAQLATIRAAVDRRCAASESFQHYTDAIARLMDIEKVAVESKTTKGVGKRFANVILLENAKEYAGQMRATLVGILAAGKPIDEEVVLKVTRLKAGVECNLTSPALSLDKPARSAIAAKMKSDAWQEVNRVFRCVLRKANEGKYGIAPDSFFATITRQVEDIGDIAEKELESVAAKAATVRADASRDLWGLSGGLSLVLILSGAASLVVSRGIVRPIQRVSAMLTDICSGSGDLRKRLDVTSGDEIAQMASHFNSLLDRLHGMISDIGQNAAVLRSSSTELSATASQLADGAANTSNQSTQVAAAAEQMTANMQGMAASTGQVSDNVKAVVQAVEQLTTSIGEVAASAEEAAGVANQAAQQAAASNSQIAGLGDAAREIGKVLEVIQDIAEQTNLLALNATIEAARAGEAGKGFAVVATEVKELAKQTGSATEDIRKRIQAIQNSTGQAVRSVADIGEIIGQMNELSRTIASAVEMQNVTTKEIARNVADSSLAAEAVARGVAESASASQEITRIIVSVDQAARQSAQGAAEVQTAGHDLSKMAGQFHGLVAQFSL